MIDRVPCVEKKSSGKAQVCTHPECRYAYHKEMANRARMDWISNWKYEQSRKVKKK